MRPGNDRRAAGAQPSPALLAYRRALVRQSLFITGARLLLFALLLALWEAAARAGWVNPMLTSRPSQVWQTLLRLSASGALWRHLGVTLEETAVGFGLGMGAGVGLAVLLWWWPALARILDPYLVVLNALPKIALGPIFYVWLGESRSIYGMAVSISVIVTIVMAHVGFQEVDPQKIRLMQTLGATRWQVLRKLVFPASLPSLAAAVKVNLGLTLVGVIVGEFIASRAGLGYLIIYGGQVFQMELVMTSVAILAVISALLYLLVNAGERLIVHLLHLRPSRTGAERG
jgi:NitT/TauT family transport system permease protein